MKDSINNITYEKLNTFTLSTSALILLFIWSFLEASIWFIAADFLIVIYCIINPKILKKAVTISLIASIIGGIIYFALTILYPEQITSILVNTPFVAQRNIGFVNTLFQNYGVKATLLQSITLIPFKIWTNLVVQNNLNPASYFILVTVSRFLRLFISGYIATIIGVKAKKFLKKRAIIILILYIISFLSIMVIIER